MSFQVTTALKKMMAMEGRKKVIQGATSSGKTYGIIPILYDKCIATPRIKVTVVAETLPAVKEGCVDMCKGCEPICPNKAITHKNTGKKSKVSSVEKCSCGGKCDCGEKC